MFKLRVLTLVSLLLLAIGSACALPDGTEDFSIEDAMAAGGTMQAVSVESAVEATLQAMASEATATSGLVSLSPSPVIEVATPTSSVTSGLVSLSPSPVIEVAGPTSSVTSGLVSLSPSPVIEVAGPISSVTSGLVSLSPSPVVQVATPTSVISASLATVIPTATLAITPVPVPTPIPTLEPIKIQFRDGTFKIPSSFEYFEIKDFRVENVKELNASGGISASVKWGDSNEWSGVPIDVETGVSVWRHFLR
jgi:hypothetical protein